MSDVVKATLYLDHSEDARESSASGYRVGPVLPERRATQPWESMANEDMAHGGIEFREKTNILSIFIYPSITQASTFCGDLIGDKRGKVSIPCSFEARPLGGDWRSV